MSYDLYLYIARETDLSPPDAGPGGLFSVDGPARCEDEDIPAAYLPILGQRRRRLIRLHIEGQPAPERLAAFDNWLSDVIADTNGVLIDEQAGTYLTAKACLPLPDTANEDDASAWGQMSFFFEDVEAFVPVMLPAVLEIIRTTLPEAMPARFGQYEPLQGTVEDGDVSALLAAFNDDPDQFMKARAPFAHIYSNIACEAELKKWHPNHFRRRHFLAGRLCFELRPKALTEPRLQKLMWEISKCLNAFYAEIRASECPVRAWFWRGLPAGPVRAFALGPPYVDLWPTASASVVDRHGDLLLVAPTRLDATLPEPPAHLQDPGNAFVAHAPETPDHAPVFPFELQDRR